MKNTIYLLLCFVTLNVFAQNTNSPESRWVSVGNTSFDLIDVKVIQTTDWNELIKIPQHPSFDILLTKEKEKEILAEINKRRKEIAKETLLTSDVFYVWKPYFDWLHYNDPHYILNIFNFSGKDEKVKISDMPTLSFSYVLINDTIIVDHSTDPLFKKGDMLLSINEKPVSEYLKYNYKFRYNNISTFMRFYYFNNIVDTFKVEFIRNNKKEFVKTQGLKHQYKMWDYNIQDFPESNTGYINIEKFNQNNKALVKTLQATINKFKKKGYSNVILDLRKNPGGNGDSFDNLMSLFINKPIIQYQKGAKLKVSKEVLQYYDFLTEDMIGQLVNLPEDEVIKEFKTKPKMFIDGINYYVLMSENTGSTAVTFANMLQYNNAAKLVGVPLFHNALRFGEVINTGIELLKGKGFAPMLISTTGISTVEYDEYTKAVDGVITPDIHIPYVASDYLSGKDAMLEKLLEILKKGH